jgi:hypothetical protein
VQRVVNHVKLIPPLLHPLTVAKDSLVGMKYNTPICSSICVKRIIIGSSGGKFLDDELYRQFVSFYACHVAKSN